MNEQNFMPFTPSPKHYPQQIFVNEIEGICFISNIALQAIVLFDFVGQKAYFK